MKILLSPAGNYLTDASGSMYSMTNNFLKEIRTHPLSIIAIVNNIDPSFNLSNLDPIEIHNVGRTAWGKKGISEIINLLSYNHKTTKESRKILKTNYVDIIHHLTPFAYGVSNNQTIIARGLDYPCIIGPAELEHDVGRDELIYCTQSKIPNSVFKSISAFRSFQKKHILKHLSYETLVNAEVVCVVNNKTKIHYSNIISNKKIRVIPHGVDNYKFYQTPFLNNHNILVVGNHIHRKGHKYIIKAMPSIIKEYNDAKLYITGDGPLTTDLKLLVKTLGVETNVIFCGFVSNATIRSLYSLCSVFCHPSLSEGFCHTILEAMSVGRPTVATITNGSEMIKNNVTGLVVNPGDCDEIAEKIKMLFGDYDLMVQIGNAAAKDAKNYSWTKIVNKYVDIYNNIGSAL